MTENNAHRSPNTTQEWYSLATMILHYSSGHATYEEWLRSHRCIHAEMIEITPDINDRLKLYISSTFANTLLTAKDLFPDVCEISQATIYRLLDGDGVWTPQLAANVINRIAHYWMYHADDVFHLVTTVPKDEFEEGQICTSKSIFPKDHTGERIFNLIKQHEKAAISATSFQNIPDLGFFPPDLLSQFCDDSAQSASEFGCDIEKRFPRYRKQIMDYAHRRKAALLEPLSNRAVTRVFYWPWSEFIRIARGGGCYRHWNRLAVLEMLTSIADDFLGKEKLLIGIYDDRPTAGRPADENLDLESLRDEYKHVFEVPAKTGGINRAWVELFTPECMWREIVEPYVKPEEDLFLEEQVSLVQSRLCHALDPQAAREFIKRFLPRHQRQTRTRNVATAVARMSNSRRLSPEARAKHNLNEFLKDLDERF